MSALTKNPTSFNRPLTNLYHVIERHGNDQLLKKLIDLYEKYTANEFVITFAGHFSAGKSSMINTLLQAEVLPNSPIPTSANIVKIKAGNGDAYVHFNNQQIVRYQAPYDLEKIKQFCMNKTDIHLVELSTKNNVLPNNLTLIDTPGIDA
ncbi:MAG TPA: dynamin family protein, partial [Bacillota bacterium]|nr:dynamin family protein [Bacillota bacterium]